MRERDDFSDVGKEFGRGFKVDEEVAFSDPEGEGWLGSETSVGL